MKSEIKALIDSSLSEIASFYSVSLPPDFQYDLDAPRSEAHGDLATNVALKLSRYVKKKPADVAGVVKKILAANVEKTPGMEDSIRRIEVDGPGFLNFFVSEKAVAPLLLEIKSLDHRYGASNFGASRKVLIEYVSANPTGPLTIAHGRQACIGDALARILKMTGFQVWREYYLNDTGRQIYLLGQSTWHRYRELFGEKVDFPEEGYQGDYIRALAEKVKKEAQDRYRKETEAKAVEFFSDFAVREILQGIRKDLEDLQVTFDQFFSERKLRSGGGMEKAIEELRGKGLAYESEGALWFKSSDFGDDKDRVLRKSSGDYTYLAPDIAYHQDKFRRGHEWLINLWGPDHHGYAPRLKAAVEALGHSRESLKILIVQLTTLYRKGEPVRMSTRAGEFVTLRELMDEVGVDATRVFFLLRRVESLLDFDLDLAKEKSQENPVYYLQYAHARISSILTYAGVPVTEECDLALLKEKEEFELLKELENFPRVLVAAATGLEPYRVVDYLRDLATLFHKFYTLHRVVTEDAELTKARLLLVDCVRIVLRNGLEVLGVSQPTKM